MIHRIGLRIAVVLFAWASVALAQPPRVVHATPDDGQKGVDPAATRELRIVFDQPMDHGGRSVVGGGDEFPKLVGKAHWTDEKTFVWAIKLQPDHDFWLSINSDRFTNFASAAGESATPYPISFHTRGAGGVAQADTILQDNRRAIAILREVVDEDYSYRDRLKIDWPARFKDFEAKLNATKTSEAFATEAAELLSAAKDIHISLSAGGKFVGTHRTGTAPNFNLALLPDLIPKWTEHEGGVATGRYDDGIAYILIPSWSQAQQQGLEAAYAALADAKSVIVDVRPNGGGDELIAREFAGCFLDAPKVYSKNTIRRDGHFTGPYDRVVEPNKARPAYRGNVVVLMGPKNVSSCESFLLMMRQVAGCKLVGERSYGSSGNPKPTDLGNDVIVYLPSWVDMLPDGTELEGHGVEPDVKIDAPANDLQKHDPVLQAALKILRAK